MEYCPRCMRPMTAQFCTHCGCGANEQNGVGVLPVGTRLTGSSGTRTYQLGLALGMGGFGLTYIALELETGNRVAVKEFFPTKCGWAQRAADGVTVEPRPGKNSEYNRGRISFLKEARVLASMKDSHPAMVKGLDYVETHNTAYLVMEYLSGTPLYKMVRKQGRLSPEELLPKIDRLMDGIIWLHQQGIIHRDLCPDNIMWMDDGTLKLMDFGSARVVEGNSELTGNFKPGYSPIEQVTSEAGKQGTWTDVYTLAATMCYCFSGKAPIISTERMYRIEDCGLDPLQPPDNLNPQQAAALTHALAIRPKERTRTMEQLRQELCPAPSPAPAPQPFPPVQPHFPAQQYSPGKPAPTVLDWIREHLIAVVSAAVLGLVLILILILLASGGALEALPDGCSPGATEGAGPQNGRELYLVIEKTCDPAI